MNKILYFDMDNVLVDFQSGLDRLDETILKQYEDNLDEIPGLFSLMDPLKNAIESYEILNKHFDSYILSTAPWNNPSAWTDKLLWVKKHLGQSAHKRLIISHNKHLNAGDFLIDDRLKNGAEKFPGELIHFGTSAFPNWETVCAYLLERK